MTLPLFHTIVCVMPADSRMDEPKECLFVAEFDIPERDETIASVIARIGEQLFPVAHVLRNGEDLSEIVAIEWLRMLKRDGWVTGDPVPDFIWRHIPASYDLGYRPEAA